MAEQYDIIIRGGTVYDGSGGEPFEADVAIAGGRIAAVGKVSGTGTRRDRRHGPDRDAGFRRPAHAL